MPGRGVFRTVTTAVCVGALLFCTRAESRPRGPSAAQMKSMAEQQAYMQLEVMRYQSEMVAKQQEIMRSFDKDGDGKLSPPEKSRYDKHMKDIEKGAVENPFTFIQPVGQGPRPKSPIEELKNRAAQYQAGILAKQQEIIQSFDENGDGELKGPEKSKFDKYMRDVQTGKAPDPFATIGAPAGSGGK